MAHQRSLGVTAASVGTVVLAVLGGCVAAAGDTPASASSSPAIDTTAEPRCEIRRGPIAVAVSGRANNPSPALPDRVIEIVRTMVAQTPPGATSPPVRLINLDGRPSIVASARFSSNAANDYAWQADRQNFLESFQTSVAAVRAVAPDVDVVSGLDIAGRATRAEDDGGVVVIVDSMLSTTGSLDFSQPHVLDAPADQVVTFLRAHQAIPDLTGLTVVLVGVGDVAAPQDPLRSDHRIRLVELYQKLATAGQAACVEVVRSPRSGAAPSNVPPVKLVPVPAAVTFVPSNPGPIVLPDAGPVGFLPDQATFRDPAGVRQALAPIAQWLKADSTRRLLLVGTTARVGSRDGQIDLATRRAEAIKASLVAQGADPAQITTRGLGSYFSEYVPDHDSQGVLLPGPAQANRTVRVIPA